MLTVPLPQGTISYRASGPADATKPVVFVHGFLVNGELWTGVAAAVAARGIRSYAPDWPLGAHTVAMNPDAAQSPRGVAEMVQAFLERLDLDDVTLVGNDTGGAIIQFLLDTDHSRVGRVVLTNCDAFDQFPPRRFAMLFKIGRRASRIRTFLAPTRLTALRHSKLAFGGLVATPLDPDLTRRWIQPCLTDRAVRRDTARFLRSVNRQDLLDVSTRLHHFPKPVRFVWGTADRAFELDLAIRLAEIFPDASIVEVADSKTLVPLDAPHRLADEIAAF